jgi:hypothetical protein
MDSPEQDETRYTQNYKIDYAHVDVARIMDQVKAKASQSSAREIGPDGSEPCPAGPPPAFVPQEPLTLKKKVKNKLLRFLTPFFPIQRLIALPVHEDLMQTNRDLFETNQRVDQVFDRESTSMNYIKLLHVLCHNLVMELTKLRIEHDTLKSRVQTLDKELDYLGRREHRLEKTVVR